MTGKAKNWFVELKSNQRMFIGLQKMERNLFVFQQRYEVVNYYIFLGFLASFILKPKDCSYSLLLIFKESYFILKYDAEAVAAAKERGDEVSEDGVEEAFDVSVTIPNY